MSVDHFPELQEDIDHLERSRQLCDVKIFRYSHQHEVFVAGGINPGWSVIILAVISKPMLVNFLNGENTK
jgi:hypothetical protein